MKIVIDDKIPFIKGALEPYADVVYLPGAKTGPEDVRDADALITRTRTICNESLLKGSKVKAIASATIGYDHIDTQWCESHGIDWTNSPGCNCRSVKTYIASMLVSLCRERGWQTDCLTLGVVGVGNVGKQVAKVGLGLGMRVLLNDPPRERKEDTAAFCSLDEIMEQADIITLHVPLEKEGPDATWHLFDAERIGRMKKNQYLINASRGPVVDNSALKEALKEGRISGASLDVWEGEPAIDPELVELLDYATPHIAGYSQDGKATGTMHSVNWILNRFGLAASHWVAPGVPVPSLPMEFHLDACGRPAQDVLTEAVQYVYKISEDSDALREDLSRFEYLRGHYPVRRDIDCYTVHLHGGSDYIYARLVLLGFQVIREQ